MGVPIALGYKEDDASGAQVIDGGLRFDSAKSQRLVRTPSSTGNRKTFTLSLWTKRNALGGAGQPSILAVPVGSNDNDYFQFGFYQDNLYMFGYSTLFRITSPKYRDISGWYHLVFAADTTQTDNNDRMKFYVNGIRVTDFSTNNTITQYADLGVNRTAVHNIGIQDTSYPYDGHMSQFYLIDGQALDPSYFGYTDPLTNTWRPKKYTGTYGTNGFYLPLDGNTPIGQDRSGNNNNWTPVNFGGSNTIEKATGALPILNTDGGGKVARVGVRTDSNASSLVLALPLVGIKSDFSNAVNSGTSNKAITVSGSAAASSTQSNFYDGSFAFDGTGDYVYPAQNSDFSFGTGDFTIECWGYATSISNTLNTFFDTRKVSDGTVGFGVFLNSSGQWRVDAGTGSGISAGNAGTGIANKWYHVALVRDSGTVKLFVDGNLNGSVSNTTNLTSQDITIGYNYDRSTWSFTGYLQDLRIYKGLAKYTQNFIPASTDPDILPDTPSGVAYSSNVALVPSTDGAVAFDGSSQYLTVPKSTDFDFPSDFTMECLFYLNSLPGTNATFFESIDWNSQLGQYQFGISSSNTLQFYVYDGGNTYYSGTTTLAKGVWYHAAVSRSSGTIRLFLNGILEYSVSNSYSLSNSNQPNASKIGATKIGSSGSGAVTSYLSGIISNVHVVKGTALYTSNFTPPTAPITSVANTKLLCCKSNSSATTSSIAPSLASQLNAPLSSTPFTDSSTNGKTITNPDSITTTSAGTNSFNLTTVANFNGSQRLTTTQTGMPFTGAWTIDTYIKIDSSASGYNAIINTGYNSGADKYVYIGIDDSDKPYLEDVGTTGTRTTASTAISKNTWYHIRVTQGDGSMKLYVNGALYVSHTTNTFNMVTGGTFTIGSLLSGSNNANNFHGLMGPVRYVNGNLGAPAAGGEATSSGTLSNSPTGEAIALFGNAVATNFNPFTVNINTQRGQESGYCTLNPNDKPSSASVTISNGNLRATDGNSGSYSLVVSNAGLSTSITDTGYYLEVTNLKTTSGNSAYTGFSFWRVGGGTYNNLYPPGTATYNPNNGYTYSQNGGVTPWGGSTVSSQPTWQTAGDVFSVAVKGSNVWFAKNGVWISGNPATGTSPYTTIPSGYGQVFPAALALETGDQEFNFGQKPFKFPPPAGFQPLALANTPRPTIVRPDQYVGIVTYTGTTANPVSIKSTNFTFTPDFVWVKSRSNGESHALYDTVRGATYRLRSDTTGAETTGANELQSFIPGGFTAGNNGHIYYNGYTYVAWCWKAGGNSNTYNINDIGYSTASAAGLTAGTITPTGASVNTKSGFSIIAYTGTGSAGSVPHGLGKEPYMIILKTRGVVDDWRVYHKFLDSVEPEDYYLMLQSTLARSADQGASFMNDTAPTSTTFSLGTDSAINGNTRTMIAYCWAEIPGFSKFGSYTGNNSTDGPAVITGFRPAFVLIRQARTDATGRDWMIFDNKRSVQYGAGGFNVISTYLYPNYSNAEASAASIDFLSNGFKIRASDSTNNNINSSGQNHIYAAFAEAPSFNLYGGQSNAR